MISDDWVKSKKYIKKASIHVRAEMRGGNFHFHSARWHIVRLRIICECLFFVFALRSQGSGQRSLAHNLKEQIAQQHITNVGRKKSDKSDWKLRVGNSSSSYTSYKNLIAFIMRPRQQQQQLFRHVFIIIIKSSFSKAKVWTKRKKKCFFHFYLNTSARENAQVE